VARAMSLRASRFVEVGTRLLWPMVVCVGSGRPRVMDVGSQGGGHLGLS
jgi:hypothetical protein